MDQRNTRAMPAVAGGTSATREGVKTARRVVRAMSTTELAGKSALVTGGTSGIGRETARLLAERGARVVITGRDPKKGAAALEALRDTGDVQFVQADLSDLDSIDSLVSQVGEVDVVVNNAGAFPVAPTVDQDVASFEKVFDTNVRGPYFLVAKLAPQMLAKGGGAIVNISTMGTAVAIPGASAYSASKAALESLTKTWALEFAPQIRVNAVAPGPALTEGTQAEWGDQMDEVAALTAFKRLAGTAEIAEAVAFLASPRSSYVTGETLRADAGGAVI